MDKKALIDMLNRDLTDEHAAVIRYLIHAYQEGEDTPVGASLLSRSREEMWHMHWLGMIIGRLGGEPDFSIGPYPFDPASRATMLKSYVEYEEKLIPHYTAEADKVDDPHIRRVLQREAWESAIHARRFQRLLEKLSPEVAKGLPEGDHELPPAFTEKLKEEFLLKYTEMLQHIRTSWVFQAADAIGWKIMDQAMEKDETPCYVCRSACRRWLAAIIQGGGDRHKPGGWRRTAEGDRRSSKRGHPLRGAEKRRRICDSCGSCCENGSGGPAGRVPDRRN